MNTDLDPLATPEQRREIWAMIASLIATDQRNYDGFRGGARMALDFALMDDPPREWPAGTYGHPASILKRVVEQR